MPLKSSVLTRCIAAIALLLSFCGLLRAAQFGDFTYQDYGFYVVITDYPTNRSGPLTIPATINGKPVTKIGLRAFDQCSLLTSVTLPSSITDIEAWAFSYCSDLATINFPSGLRTVGFDAFSNCDSLTTVELPASLTAIVPGAFSRCANLTFISVSASNPAYASQSGVLFDKSITKLNQYPTGKTGAYTVPATVIEIEEDAFSGAKVTGIQILPGLKRIGRSAFGTCSNLSQVSLPSTLEDVGHSAFSNSGLTAVSLPSSVKSIGDLAFSGCNSLTKVNIPENVSSLGTGVFISCNLLHAITVSPGNPNFSEKDGVVFDESGSTLLQFPTGRSGHYAVPYGVSSIAADAFYGSRNLVAVSLPVGLKSIGARAFWFCSRMQTTQLPFGLSTIGVLAFSNCSALEEITFPASVTSIANDAFRSCPKLAHATFRGNAPVMGGSVFTSAPAAFEIRHYQDAAGFDAAAWPGFKLVNLGFLTEIPGDIIVHSAFGGEYASGIDSENFGFASTGQSVARVFTIRNGGELPLTGLVTGRDGPSAAEFVVGQTGTATVAPGESTTFSVTFQPKSGGNKQAVLRISSSDPDDDPFEIGLVGQVPVPVPEIVVMQPAGSSLIDGKAKRSFGTVKIGSKGTSKTFTIKNTGTARLSGLLVSKSGSHKGDFIVGALPRTVLEPGKSMTFRITFKAKAKGTRNAAIQIKSNDANENPFDFKVAGMGAP